MRRRRLWPHIQRSNEDERSASEGGYSDQAVQEKPVEPWKPPVTEVPEGLGCILDFEVDDNIEYDRGTDASPGSQDKVAILAARFAMGVPLFRNDDCQDYAPDLEDEDDNEWDEVDPDYLDVVPDEALAQEESP